MRQALSTLTDEISEIENVFILLADYSKNIIMGDDIFNDVSCNQYRVLMFLNDNIRVTVHDIVKSENISNSATTILLDGLSKLNLIERRRSDDDRRLVFVTITEKGRDILKDITKKHRSTLTQIFEGFKPDEMKLIMGSFSLLKNKLITLKDKK